MSPFINRDNGFNDIKDFLPEPLKYLESLQHMAPTERDQLVPLLIECMSPPNINVVENRQSRLSSVTVKGTLVPYLLPIAVEFVAAPNKYPFDAARVFLNCFQSWLRCIYPIPDLGRNPMDLRVQNWVNTDCPTNCTLCPNLGRFFQSRTEHYFEQTSTPGFKMHFERVRKALTVTDITRSRDVWSQVLMRTVDENSFESQNNLDVRTRDLGKGSQVTLTVHKKGYDMYTKARQEYISLVAERKRILPQAGLQVGDDGQVITGGQVVAVQDNGTSNVKRKGAPLR